MRLADSTMAYVDQLLARHNDLTTVRDGLVRGVAALCTSYRSGGKILICGNGGSASDSEHIVGELMKGFVLKRELPGSDTRKLETSGFDDWCHLATHLQQGIPAIALTGHAALSSAVLNDTEPYMTFAQQVYVLGRAGDVLIGLSTSGGARNVLNALKVGKAFGLTTIGFTGSRPSEMDDICDIMIKAPSIETYRVQEYHLAVYHTLCLMLECELFGCSC